MAEACLPRDLYVFSDCCRQAFGGKAVLRQNLGLLAVGQEVVRQRCHSHFAGETGRRQGLQNGASEASAADVVLGGDQQRIALRPRRPSRR